MSEYTAEYKVINADDGDETKIVFLHRICSCNMSGCVDDEVQIFIDGENEAPYRLQVPREMTPYLEGVLSGEYIIKSTEEPPCQN